MRRWQAKQWLAILLVSAALAACSSVSITYRNAPTLAAWWVNRQLDLPAAHREALERALEDTQRWHAREPRQALSAILRGAAQRFTGPVGERDLDELIGALERHVDIVAAHFAGALLPRLPPFRADQLARIEARLADRQRHYAEERLGGDKNEQNRRRRDRLGDAAEDWFGRVTPVQRDMIARSVSSGVFDDGLWVAERARRQQGLVEALGGGMPTVGGVQDSALQHWFANWRRDRSPEVSTAVARQRQAGISLWLEMINAATPTQRDHLRARLLGWADDLDGAARAVLLAHTNQQGVTE